MTCKSIGASLAKSHYDHLLANPIAVDLGLEDPQGPSVVLRQMMEGGEGGDNLVYLYLMEACEKLFENEMDQATFEEQMRWFFGTKVRLFLCFVLFCFWVWFGLFLWFGSAFPVPGCGRSQPSAVSPLGDDSESGSIYPDVCLEFRTLRSPYASHRPTQRNTKHCEAGRKVRSAAMSYSRTPFCL